MTKNNNTNNQNMNNISTKQPDNKQYNVIINQNSTFNQDNSINIMLDGSFPYFQNYNNYQTNETETNKNQIYPVYLEKQVNKEQNDNNIINIDNKEKNKIINNDEKIKDDNISTPKNKSKTKIKKRRNHSPKNKQSKSPKDNINQDSTNKIDYRYIKKRPIKEMIMPYKNEEKEINKEEQHFWFATYDKLMKTKYLLKIFNYYNNKPFESHQNLKYDLKEKTLVIKDFEIYFYENSNKPFIRYEKGGTIYTKLYLLTLKQINQIFSYLNRIDYKINYDILTYLQRKGTFQIINDNSNEVILPYCLIYSLGKYMNINIYAFTNNIDYNIYSEENSFQKSQRISSYTMVNNDNKNLRLNYLFSNDKKNTKMDNTNINRENFKLPNSKKIAKLIKIINLNYPDFSIDDIINYLIPENKYMNAITKINEIKNLFFFKKSNQNKIILSSMVRDTIKGISIQTQKSLISSFCTAESIIENNSFKNSDLFQPVSKKYVIPMKDDYKFQTINTNEKDNNKTNPFIIYVCDNVQKINFTNDNQSNNINNINNINNNYPKPKQKNISNELNNYIETNSYLQTDINQQTKDNNINKQNLKVINKNKAKKEIKLNNLINPNSKPINIKNKERNKIKSDKIGNNNLLLSNKQREIRMKRISTDIITKRQKAKYNNNFSGLLNEANKVRKSYKITRPKLISSHLNNAIKQLNKSIENHHNNTAINHFSKTSDINVKKIKSSNKTKLIARINMNKKDNYFSDKYNTNY